MSVIESREAYHARKKELDERFPVAKNPANKAVEEKARRVGIKHRCARTVNVCETRGASHTDFPRNTLLSPNIVIVKGEPVCVPKGDLDRCGLVRGNAA